MWLGRTKKAEKDKELFVQAFCGINSRYDSITAAGLAA